MRTLFALVAAALFCSQDPKAEPFAKDIAAFEAKDKTSPPPDNEIVFVGSSSIRMWKSTEAFPDLKIINRGFGRSPRRRSTSSRFSRTCSGSRRIRSARR